VVEIVMFEKASALNIRRGDQPIGIATVLLAQLPPEPTVLWYDLMPARPGDHPMGAVKIATHPHFIPTLRLNRPRREVSRVRGNAAKGLGTIEMVVVAAKQLQAADGRDRECRVQVHCGTHMITVEGQSKGLNPVWNKPVVMEVFPDVEAVSFEVLDRLGTATNGGKWLGTVQVHLDELAEVRPALNARTNWTRLVPHPVLIERAATGGRVRLLVRSAAGERAEGAGFAARAAQLRAGLPSRFAAQGF